MVRASPSRAVTAIGLGIAMSVSVRGDTRESVALDIGIQEWVQHA